MRPGVTRLGVAYGFDVRAHLGQPEAVTVTYDDNLANLLDVQVDDRTLRLQLRPNASIEPPDPAGGRYGVQAGGAPRRRCLHRHRGQQDP
jgi:hypothetical protein